MPIGPIAFKVGLASALCQAAAAALTAALGADVSRRVRASLGAPSAPGIEALLGAAAGLLFGLSYAGAFQAVRPEVYALSTLLGLGALREAGRFQETGERRRLYRAMLLGGLALSNHHLLALALLGPAALVLCGRPRRSSLSLLGWSALAVALGLLVWAYLPVRAGRHPLVDWGAPTTWARFAWTVSARAFHKSLERGSSGDALAVVPAVAEQLHPLGLLLAGGGLYVLLRLGATRRLGLLLGLPALAEAATPALVGFDSANPDAYGYLAAAVAALAAAATALPAALGASLSTGIDRASATPGGGRRRAGSLGLAAGLLALSLAQGAAGWSRVSRAGAWDAAEVGRFFDRAPPRTLLVSSYFQTVFVVWYLRLVEGLRPDVDHLHRHFLAYPGYREELLRTTPDLAPLLGTRELAADPAIAGGRRLRLEYDLDLPDAWLPMSDTITLRRADLHEPQTRRFAAWQAFLAVHRACRLGDGRAFARRLRAARALIGPAPELDALVARCAAARAGEKLRSFDAP